MQNLVDYAAWHELGWNGHFCENPRENNYCESFRYVRAGKYGVIRRDRDYHREVVSCLNHPREKLDTILKNYSIPCFESLMFADFKIPNFGRVPYVRYTNNTNEDLEIIRSCIGKYCFIYVRENPLSENKVLIGCVKVRDIKNLGIRTQKRIGGQVDFNLEDDVVFVFPYQELIKYCKEKDIPIPDNLVFDLGKYRNYFKSANFISDDVAIEIFEEVLECLKNWDAFLEENKNFKEYLYGEKAFRGYLLRNFVDYKDNVRLAIQRLKNLKSKYPGLAAVRYYLGDNNSYRDYLAALEEQKEEELYNKTKNEISNNKNIDEKFKKLLIEYLPYYNITSHSIKCIKEQIDKGYINIDDILKNPYTLVEDLKRKDDFEGFRFIEIDNGEKRRLSENYNLDNPYRYRAILVEILKDNLLKGNTTIADTDIKNELEKLDIDFNKFKEILNNNLSLFKEKVDINEITVDNETITIYTLKEIRKYEEIIENTINELINKEIREIQIKRDDIEKLLKKENIEIDKEKYEKALSQQIDAVLKLVKNNVSILTGAAGVGKSEVIRAVVELLKNEKIYILTPTGKAAMVLKERIRENNNIKVMTIHRFLATNFREYFDFDYYILKDVDNKLKIDTLILDESSMIDLITLGDLFKCIKAKRIIFVGDINQLPPVDAGKPFHDIYVHLNKVNKDLIAKLEIPLRAKSEKINELSKLFIDIDYEEKEKILDNILKENKIDDNNKIVIKDDSGNEIITIEVTKDLKKSLENAIDKILSENNSNFFDFAVFNDNLQILSPTKTKRFGSYNINLFIKHESKYVPERFRKYMIKHWFYGNNNVGDKVIVNKNIYEYKIYNYDRNTLENGVFNGMMGYIYSYWKRTNGYRKQIFKIKFYVPNASCELNKPIIDYLEHAYSITIHKSQGSGFNNVILIIPKNLGKFVSKEMIYTAITRAKERLYIIVEDDIKNFIDVTVSELARRKTNLFNNFNISYIIPYANERNIITINGEKVRSWQECILANFFNKVGINYEYEPLSKFLELGVLPDFELYSNNKIILWEHYGMTTEEYLARQEEKERLYREKGFQIIRINELNKDTKLNDKVLITSTSEDLRDNNELLEKLEILKSLIT
ncbi:AAA family ATPase [Methanocaldococcus indicus]|uniref:AAA family ATPase n=1 Tax=Methanocaldococcus indicus TaxID=213231 RepID=UPI003C6CF2E7